jgi:uncharacterized membrane protein (UPF0182 family)
MLALTQAMRYWVGRYQLTFSTRGTVDGATYTASNVELRSTYLLVMIALFACGLLIANIWRRGWTLPVMAVGLWMFVAAVAGGIVPAFVQRFRVEPSESSMEAPYLRHNIDATRMAYGLDVQTETFKWDGKLDAATLGEEVETLQNVRLWDPAIIKSSFERQQQLKGFYEINDVDVDRYEVDGSYHTGDGVGSGPRHRWRSAVVVGGHAPGLHPRLRGGGGQGQRPHNQRRPRRWW